MVVDQHDAALHDALRVRCSSTSVPLAGARHDGRTTAGALEPPLDRLDEAAAVGRHGGAVEARAAVAHEDGDLLVGDLGVDVDLLDARELGRVRHRLARRQHDGADGGIDRAVARARELDAHAVELLDVARRRRERRHERRVLVADRLVVVQPAAQLALLPARQRRHPARLGCMPLDQRQRLQHRVVHPRGDVGALVAADPGGALGVAVERESPHPGAGDQQQRAGDGAGREQRRGRRRRPTAARPRRSRPARSRRRRAVRRAGSCRPGATRARARPRSGRSRPPTGRRGRGR